MVIVCLACLLRIDNVCRVDYAEYAEPPRAAEIAPQSEETISRGELCLIEQIVAAESRGEPQEAQMAVAQTILDRSLQSGLTVSEVCTAPGQFAPPYQGEISEEVKESVYFIFVLGQRVYEDPVLSFHDDSVKPYWTADKVCRGQIGRMIFYGE